MGTIFVDLDGTIVHHNYDPVLTTDVFLPGALFKLNKWSEDYEIIITTARSEADCLHVMGKMNNYGVKIKQWVFNLGTGPRYLINDTKEGEAKARAIEVPRNQGLAWVELC